MTTVADEHEISDTDVQRPQPRRVGQVGMWLFLAALTMLFAAALLGYLIIRLRAVDSLPMRSLTLPGGLWFSTFCILVSGVTIELACRFAREERQRALRRAMAATVALTVLFVVIQTPSLVQLLRTHNAVRAGGTTLYGLVFVIILLHALHVVGGLVPVFVTSARAFRGRYDHEHWHPVRYAAMYWHFLAVVWIVTFAVFTALG